MTGRTFIVREEIAAIVGLNAAILHERLKFMAEQNYREGRNQFDGATWVASTYEQWAEYIPVLSAKQIRTAFARLIDAGMVKTGCYNKQNTDRKLWYALTDEAQYLGAPDLPSRANGSAPQGKSASAPQGKSYKDTETTRNLCVEDTHKAFEEFWKAHPRSIRRDETKEAFEEAVAAGTDPKWIARSAFLYAKEQDGNAKQYIATSLSWLEKSRWQDFEPPSQKKADPELLEKMLASPVPAVRAAARKLQEALQ